MTVRATAIRGINNTSTLSVSPIMTIREAATFAAFTRLIADTPPPAWIVRGAGSLQAAAVRVILPNPRFAGAGSLSASAFLHPFGANFAGVGQMSVAASVSKHASVIFGATTRICCFATVRHGRGGLTNNTTTSGSGQVSNITIRGGTSGPPLTPPCRC